MEPEVICDHCEFQDVIGEFSLVEESTVPSEESAPVEMYWCPHCGAKTTISDDWRVK